MIFLILLFFALALSMVARAAWLSFAECWRRWRGRGRDAGRGRGMNTGTHARLAGQWESCSGESRPSRSIRLAASLQQTNPFAHELTPALGRILKIQIAHALRQQRSRNPDSHSIDARER